MRTLCEPVGAVLLGESAVAAAAAAAPLPARAAELIGYPPTQRYALDVEADVEGEFAVPALAGRGAALESPVDRSRPGR